MVGSHLILHPHPMSCLLYQGGGRMRGRTLPLFPPPLIASSVTLPGAASPCSLGRKGNISPCTRIYIVIPYNLLPIRSPMISSSCARVQAPVYWSLPVKGRKIECPLGTAAWLSGSGATCAYQGRVDATSGLLCKGTPRPGSGLYCAWGPGWKHFGTDGGLYQICRPGPQLLATTYNDPRPSIPGPWEMAWKEIFHHIIQTLHKGYLLQVSICEIHNDLFLPFS